MRQQASRGWFAFALFAALVLTALLRDADGQDTDRGRIADWIRQLADPIFSRREAAGKALQALGDPALPALRSAAETDPDLEVRRRARLVMRAITPVSRKSPSIGLAMVLIDSGSFLMGSPVNEGGRQFDEAPHPVRITREFYLGAYEVTQEEYQKVMNTNPSWFCATGPGANKVHGYPTDRQPVEQVNWFGAIEFCNRLSERDGYPPYYRIARAVREDGVLKQAEVSIAGGNGYRLPTEAEWEYACRAGTRTAFHFGLVSTGREANFRATLGGGYAGPSRVVEVGRTVLVGRYDANAWGLHDMHGNVAEWCWDWHDRDYYAASQRDDPHGPARGAHRVLRGGSWLVSTGNCRSASRFGHLPGERHYYAGFRVARTP